jgi:hypothetical protein
MYLPYDIAILFLVSQLFFMTDLFLDNSNNCTNRTKQIGAFGLDRSSSHGWLVLPLTETPASLAILAVPAHFACLQGSIGSYTGLS